MEMGLGEGMYANLSFQSAGWVPKLKDDGNGFADTLFVDTASFTQLRSP